MKQIILEDPEVRLNIIRHIFGVDKYKRIRENLSILLVYIKDKIKELQLEIRNLDQDKFVLGEKKNSVIDIDIKIDSANAKFFDCRSKRKIIESETEEINLKVREKEQFEKEVEKTKIQIASKNESLLKINKELLDISNTLSEVKEMFNEKTYNTLISNILEKRKLLDVLNAKYIDIAGNISSLEKNKADNFEKKDRVFNISFCPTCLQNVSYAHKHNILNETEGRIVELSKQIEVMQKDRDNLISEIDVEKKSLSIMDEEKMVLEILRSKTDYLDKSKKKLIDLEKEKVALEKDIALLSNHMDSLKGDILSFSRFLTLLKRKQDELKLAFVEEKNAEILLAELKKEKEITLSAIADMEAKVRDKEKLRDKLNSLIELNNWLSSQFSNLVDFTERNVLMKIRFDFSQLFGEWFKMLVSDDSFEVRLDENFTPLLIQSDIEMDYSFLSGGERTAVALAYRLALNQTINSVLSQIKTRDIVMLDEPTDGFSETQIDKIRDVLGELNARQLIIVSHEQKIEGFVDNIIRLKKEADVSSTDNNLKISQP